MLIRWNSWNHFRCNIDEKLIKETGTSFSSFFLWFKILKYFAKKKTSGMTVSMLLEQLMQWYQGGLLH